MDLRRTLQLALVTAIALATVSPATQAQPNYACRYGYSLETQNRHVYGDPNAECSGDVINCFPFFGHSVPFGNWGVESNHSSRIDGDQFAGWHDHDGHQEWNSCYDEYPPPDSDKFNYASDTEQITDVGVLSYGSIGWEIPNTYCDVLDNAVFTEEDDQLLLYELDPCDEDEYVASVYYPEMSATATCPNPAYCYGTSDWTNPSLSGPDIVSAEARLNFQAHFSAIP